VGSSGVRSGSMALWRADHDVFLFSSITSFYFDRHPVILIYALVDLAGIDDTAGDNHDRDGNPPDLPDGKTGNRHADDHPVSITNRRGGIHHSE
jgi:hypothetical protein